MRDVFGCYLTSGNQVEYSFMRSITSLQVRDEATDKRLHLGQVWAKQSNSGGVFAGRNELTRMFLETPCEWMWMVDSDMGFEPDALDRLLASARAAEVTMAGALCFTWDRVEPDGMGGWYCRPKPTIYGHDGQGFKAVSSFESGAVVKAAGTGAAFVVIHRSVMEQVRREHGQNWWTPLVDEGSGQFLGEDLSFFLRANLAGHRLVIDTSIGTSHAKTIHLSEKHYRLWVRGGEA